VKGGGGGRGGGCRAWAPRAAPRAQAALADARIPLVEVAQGDADGDAELELDDDPAHATRLDTARVPVVLTVAQARWGPAGSARRAGRRLQGVGLAGGPPVAAGGLQTQMRRAERACWACVLLGGCRSLPGPAVHAPGALQHRVACRVDHGPQPDSRGTICAGAGQACELGHKARGKDHARWVQQRPWGGDRWTLRRLTLGTSGRWAPRWRWT